MSTYLSKKEAESLEQSVLSDEEKRFLKSLWEKDEPDFSFPLYWIFPTTLITMFLFSILFSVPLLEYIGNILTVVMVAIWLASSNSLKNETSKAYADGDYFDKLYYLDRGYVNNYILGFGRRTVLIFFLFFFITGINAYTKNILLSLFVVTAIFWIFHLEYQINGNVRKILKLHGFESVFI